MKKVAVWGRFDVLHQGHLELLRHARELGDELYVIVMPDEKSRDASGEPPKNTAEVRRRELIKLSTVTDAYIDCLDYSLKSLLVLRPDIFAFGHDQRTEWERRLQEFLSSNGLHPEYIYLGVYNNGLHASDIKRSLLKG